MTAKITLEIKGVEVELTLDEARELWAVLNQMFGTQQTIWTYPVVPTYPAWDQWKYTCSADPVTSK